MLPAKIHPTAIVDASAKIGSNVVIGPYAIIGKNTTIGDNTNIGPFCVVENTIMGKDNELIASAFIGVKPQDLSYDGVESMVVMGNGNKVREGVTIHRSTSLEHPTKIGDHCLFMANAHVAHDCILGNRIILVNSAGIAGHVVVSDGAILSGMVAVHQFVRIGKLAMASGLSGLPLDLPPFCRASGGRAKLVGLNTVGLRRAGFTRESIKAIKDAYRVLFLSKHTLKEGLELLKKSNPTPEVQEMIDFCENSKRGLIGARKKTHGAVEDDNED
ncbi:MAG: acyl-ACP--UDP-N-acetylglucosamine O-acyltransferase [Elusimicrobiota bacterium]|jgi:UDP-N-acetylglucosamine acyltransferase|nr:acyl-ACP--UDP-N-acetylglucosamine O-acyltransferase [Elusimicrobiota bacterium]